MSERLTVTARDRVMVVAPHPDDEALAAGGLLSTASRVGAAARVVYFTDGDNNPWAQRAVERRLRIGPEQRRSFGARRRVEAVSGLRRLGLGADSAQFLGFPDQGATELLVRSEPSPLDALSAAVRAFRPTLLVAPSALDLHPDHSAIAVLIAQALRRLATFERPGRALSYLVHNPWLRSTCPAAASLPLGEESQGAKREAICCHESQLFWRRSEYLSFVTPNETFWPPECEGLPARHPVHAVEWSSRALRLAVTAQPTLGSFRPRQLLLAGSDESLRPLRLSLALPGGSGATPIVDLGTGATTDEAALVRRNGDWVVSLPSAALGQPMELYAKVERRFGFFDEAGWMELATPDLSHSGVCALTAG